MVCTICGDHAIGFNYDALSCASCKAFFRRNANQHSVSLIFFFYSNSMVDLDLFYRTNFDV
jgi:hypothetical protein